MKGTFFTILILLVALSLSANPVKNPQYYNSSVAIDNIMNRLYFDGSETIPVYSVYSYSDVMDSVSVTIGDISVSMGDLETRVDGTNDRLDTIQIQINEVKAQIKQLEDTIFAKILYDYDFIYDSFEGDSVMVGRNITGYTIVYKGETYGETITRFNVGSGTVVTDKRAGRIERITYAKH